MIHTIVGVISVVLSTLINAFIIMDPNYKFPMLIVMQAVAVALWLAYAIIIENQILLVGSAIEETMLVGYLIWTTCHHRVTYQNVPVKK